MARLVGSAIEPRGHGDVLRVLHRFGGTSVLRHLAWLVNPDSEAWGEVWHSLWPALTTPLPGIRDTVDLRDRLVDGGAPRILPVYLSLAPHRTQAGLAAGLSDALRDAIAGLEPASQPAWGWLDAVARHTDVVRMIRAIRRERRSQIVWLLFDEAAPLLHQGSRDRSPAAGLLIELRDAIDAHVDDRYVRIQATFLTAHMHGFRVADGPIGMISRFTSRYVNLSLPLWSPEESALYLANHTSDAAAEDLWPDIGGSPWLLARVVHGTQGPRWSVRVAEALADPAVVSYLDELTRHLASLQLTVRGLEDLVCGNATPTHGIVGDVALPIPRWLSERIVEATGGRVAPTDAAADARGAEEDGESVPMTTESEQRATDGTGTLIPRRPTEAQRKVVSLVAHYHLSTGKLLEGRVIRGGFQGVSGENVDAALRSCVPMWLFASTYPVDEYGVTLDGILCSPEAGRATLVIETLIGLLRILVSRPGEQRYTWGDLCAREPRLDRQQDLVFAHTVLINCGLSGSGSLENGWTLPLEVERIVRCVDVFAYANLRRELLALWAAESSRAFGRTMSASSLPQAALQADVLLVVVTPGELSAVFAAAAEATGSPQPRGTSHGEELTYHDLGVIGGAHILLVQSEMGTGSVGGSLATILTAASEVRPSTILMVGIAFGVNPEKQAIGEILVSKQVQQYDLQRVGTDEVGTRKVIPRGDKATASPTVLSRLRAASASFRDVPVKFELLLSGEKLVDNHDYRDELRVREPEAEGGEMEGGGLYVAATQKRIGWCIVKAICDYADGKKRENKHERQETAARNAARFVVGALVQGGFAGRPRQPDPR